MNLRSNALSDCFGLERKYRANQELSIGENPAEIRQKLCKFLGAEACGSARAF